MQNDSYEVLQPDAIYGENETLRCGKERLKEPSLAKCRLDTLVRLLRKRTSRQRYYCTICQNTEVGKKPTEYSREDETWNFKRRT